jgi:hypothetical protein
MCSPTSLKPNLKGLTSLSNSKAYGGTSQTAYLEVSPSVAACLSRDFETLYIDEKLNVMNQNVDHPNDREMKALMMRNVCFEPFWRMLGTK